MRQLAVLTSVIFYTHILSKMHSNFSLALPTQKNWLATTCDTGAQNPSLVVFGFFLFGQILHWICIKIHFTESKCIYLVPNWSYTCLIRTIKKAKNWNRRIGKWIIIFFHQNAVFLSLISISIDSSDSTLRLRYLSINIKGRGKRHVTISVILGASAWWGLDFAIGRPPLTPPRTVPDVYTSISIVLCIL